MRSNLNEINTLSAWVRTLVRGAGLNMVFESTDDPSNPPCPRTSETTIYIPAFNNMMTDDDIHKIRHWVLHETLHHTEGPNCFKISKDNNLDNESMLGLIHNVLEDARIERAGKSRYRGDREIISNGYNTILGGYSKRYEDIKLKHGDLFDTDERFNNTQAVLVGGIRSACDWNWGASKHMRTLLDIMPAKARSSMERLESKLDLNRRTVELRDEYDSWELSKEIFRELCGDPDEELKKLKEQAEARAKASGKGEGADGEAKTPGQPGDGEEGTPGGISEWAEFVMHKHDYEDREDHVNPGHDLTLDYAKFVGPGVWQPLSLGKFKILDYPRGGITARGSMRNVLKSMGSVGSETSVAALANRVRRLLTIKAQAYYTGGHKNGRIHNRNLWKVGMPVIGTGEWNSKVFKRRHIDDVLDTAVTLAIDFSGSMSGIKLGHAGAVALMLNACISKSLRVPLEIISFTSNSMTDMPQLGIVKRFDDHINHDLMLDRMDMSSYNMAENPDGDSLLWMWKRLSNRREKRKVLIVLSDGQPTQAYVNDQPGGDPVRCLTDVVHMIEQTPNTSVYGVGILSIAVRQAYTKNVVVHSPNELEACVLKLIEKEFLRTL